MNNPTPTNHPRIRLASLLLFGAMTGLLQAQTAPADSSRSPGGNDDTIVLSPFEVRSDAENGYVATQTLAGTRIRTDLSDVGSAIQVVTKEFMSDIGATGNSSLLQYTTNTEVGGVRGTYAGLGNGATVNEQSSLISPSTNNRVRGLDAADNTRDFFVTDIPWDSFNVDRIDIQRGANSFLFGLGSPAGIINAATRNAEFRNVGEFQARVGSYGTWRTSLDYNQELIHNTLAIRIDGLKEDRKYKQDPAFQNQKRIYGALRYDPQLFKDPSFHTSIKARYEHGEINADRPRIIPPMDAISPWFRSTTVSADNPFGGAGKVLIDNPYDAFADYQSSSGAHYTPWITGANIDAQQPYWLIDGSTGATSEIRSGWINNAARNADGTVNSASAGLVGRRFSSALLGIGTLNNVATTLNLPLANYGQYRAQSLADPSIFDFYNTLIDGRTKSEFEKWDAYNIDLSQTAFNDRLGVNLIYDHQHYKRGGESFLGWQPTISIDLLQNRDDLSANPNVGRPYVTSNAGGSGTSYASNREYLRGSVFGELRATDFLNRDSLLAKLLGKQRFNGVASSEDLKTEELTWQRKAVDQDWVAYWSQTDGSTTSIDTRPPVGIVYLGGSVASLSSASGAHIPGITGAAEIGSGSAWQFDSTWNASGVAYDAPWTVPASLQTVFSPTGGSGTATVDGGGNTVPYSAYLQNSNPANYVGWSDHPVNVMSYGGGADPRLLTKARKSQRETESLAGSWQGFWWNDAIVTTLGWRTDKVKSRSIDAPQDPTNRKILHLSSDDYSLQPYEPGRILSSHSVGGGVVVHLNKLFGDHDPLPVNVSLSYNKSDNFQVGNVRSDIYGNPIDNPSGTTKDYGILLATKDGKYSLRAVKYESVLQRASADVDSYGIGATIANGLNWRNVYLYQLGLYDWNSRNQYSYRNHASQAFPIDGPATNPYHVAEGSAEELALEDQMVTGWNNIQKWLTDKGFFKAWGFTPQSVDSLTDRSTYAADPAAHAPSDPEHVYLYTATAPANFAVTADTISKGYEFEFTANPLPNWRIALNASESKAYRNNVGGGVIDEFVDFMDSQLLDANVSNGYSAAGNLPRYGGLGNAIGPSLYTPWRANYTRLKLQEGTAVPELRKWRYSVVTNYDFRRGFLKGTGIGASYRWQDKVAIGYPLVAIDNAKYTFDINSPIYGPGEDAVDLWISYQRKLTSRINWKIQLNVYNVGQGNKLIPISVEPDGRTWASARIAPSQEWTLTNTFSF